MRDCAYEGVKITRAEEPKNYSCVGPENYTLLGLVSEVELLVAWQSLQNATCCHPEKGECRAPAHLGSHCLGGSSLLGKG